MKKNIGTRDMAVRAIVGAMLLFLGLLENAFVAAGIAQGFVLAAGAVALLTAALRFCPLYSLLGINTKCGSCQSCTCKSRQTDA